jgi:exodeoxyribonuclease VII large subunit
VISAVGHEVDFTIADFVADLRAATPSAAAELVVKSKSELSAELDALSHRLKHGIHHLLSDYEGRMRLLAHSLKDPSMLLGHLAQRIDDLSERLNFSFRGELKRLGVGLVNLNNHLRLTNPGLMVERGREHLLALFGRGENALHRSLESCRERTAVNSAKLQALSPLQTLSRGFAIVSLLPEGAVIRESDQLTPGDTIDVRFHKGGAVCTVDAKRP